MSRRLPLCEADTRQVVFGNESLDLCCESFLEGNVLLFSPVPVTERLAELGEAGNVARLGLEDLFACLGWLLAAICLVHGLRVVNE